MKILTRTLILFILGLFINNIAWSHSRLVNPSPRVNLDNIKDNNGAPCGAARTNTPHTFTSGQTITVQLEETINHPGEFVIRFSMAGDANFVELTRVPDDINKGFKNINVTLPNEECTDCTLQLVQVMTDRNPPTNYYSCADLVLSTNGTPPPPNPGPNPPPVDNGGNSSQDLNSSTQLDDKPQMAGCGLVDFNSPKGPPPFGLALLTLPLIVLFFLRRKSLIPR